MRDVNGSSFHLLAGPGDWSLAEGIAWNREACTLAAKQNWRFPAAKTRAAALAALGASKPVVVDAFGDVARITADGASVESLDGASWVKLTDRNGNPLAPKVGTFVDMALADARLALLASDGANSFLELFDLRGRWALDTRENPVLPLSLDAGGVGLAVAPDGMIFVLIPSGMAMVRGGPILELFESDSPRFAPIAGNPDPLRRTALIARPGGAVIAMAADAARVALLCDQGASPQTIAVLDRTTGSWTSAPVVAIDGTALPWMTGIALMQDSMVALVASSARPDAPIDCAVASIVPEQGLALAPFRYPMLDQAAPRCAAVPGPDVFYLGTDGPRPLLPLPYPAYLGSGALMRAALAGHDPDLVWHRLYVEAYLPSGSALAFWARASETVFPAGEQAALLAIVQHAPDGTMLIDANAAAAIASANTLPAPSLDLATALAAAPLHRQPPLVANALPSELPFHQGLVLPGTTGQLYELLLQRRGGANRRLTGGFFDLVVVARGDGRHSPCLRAIRIYTPRFCYQDEYLPRFFHQTALSDETDAMAPVSPADFRERLLANLEGMLTPIENRVAAAEYLLDPYAAPASMLPWLGSYLGIALDAGWPEARQRRALAAAGQQLRARGTYRGVCLALDIATDGAVARGEVVLLETHRLRRTDATVIGVNLSGRNVLTGGGVASGNSIVGDTLVLSAERAIELAGLIDPAVAGRDPAAAQRFLDEYADRVQVAAILQGLSAAGLQSAVERVLQAELPAQLAFEVVVSDRRFVLGMSPLLDIDTFLDPLVMPAPLTLDQSVIARDAVIRDPASLRQ